MPAAPAVDDAVVAGPNPAELEAFLVNFVVEQTGYPPEVVELDADLEADLGIDSIKKAQLFGELHEYFDVAADRGPDARRFPHVASRGGFPGAAPMKSDLPTESRQLLRRLRHRRRRLRVPSRKRLRRSQPLPRLSETAATSPD